MYEMKTKRKGRQDNVECTQNNNGAHKYLLVSYQSPSLVVGLPWFVVRVRVVVTEEIKKW